MKRDVKKWVSVLLSAALIVTGTGMVAQGDTAASGTGICEHHKEHTPQCGYEAPREARPCSHAEGHHTRECYRKTATPSDADKATPSEAGKATPSEAEHDEIIMDGSEIALSDEFNPDPEEGWVLDCKHLKGDHGDYSCGYQEASEGSPCTFVCDQCGKVTYVDENGVSKTEEIGRDRLVKVSSLSQNSGKWGSSDKDLWYFVDKSCTFNDRIQIGEGHVTLLLGSGTVLTASKGINVPEGTSLTIYGQTTTGGTLKATGYGYGAGIGGDGRSSRVGEITINSGHVAAYGTTQQAADQMGYNPAAIGSGSSSRAVKVTVKGGKVEAYGTNGGAGIGGSWYNDGGDGYVRITGGNVYAKGGSVDRVVTSGKPLGGAGIGSATNSQSGTIEITGGTIEAIGGSNADGIGNGSNGYGAKVSISGDVSLTARGDQAAVDGAVDFSRRTGDYIVFGNEQNAETKEVSALRVNGDTKSLMSETAVYRYLKAEPLTMNAVKVYSEKSYADIGNTVRFAVKPVGGSHPDADLSKILNAAWSVEAPAGQYKSGYTQIGSDGLLQIGGDETAEDLIVTGSFDVPEGVTNAGSTSDVKVNQAVYTIYFDANGGEADRASLQTKQGRLTASLPTASRRGHDFTGWYTAPEGGSRITDGYVFSYGMMLYAHWEPKTYTVTYHTMGGSPETFTNPVVFGKRAGTPAFTAKEWAVFEGWYTDLSYTRRWNFDSDVVEGDMDLYAKWSDAVLDAAVTAEAVPAQGGTVKYAGRYRVGSQVTLEAEASRGYSFSCWMEGDQIVGTSPSLQITVDGDRVLTAVFERRSSGGSGGSSGGGSSGGGGGGGGGGGSKSGQTGTAQVPSAGSAPTVVPGSGSAITTVVSTAASGVGTAGVANANVVSGAWVQSTQGWILQYSDGTVASNSWICVAENDGAHWYHFGGTGIMDTGWLNLDGKVYYLKAAQSGNGRMATGWQMLNGKWYYFSSASDATLGALLTNTVTPDGYRVNAQGEWIQ